jgi:hypothetical protein
MIAVSGSLGAMPTLDPDVTLVQVTTESAIPPKLRILDRVLGLGQ